MNGSNYYCNNCRQENEHAILHSCLTFCTISLRSCFHTDMINKVRNQVAAIFCSSPLAVKKINESLPSFRLPFNVPYSSLDPSETSSSSSLPSYQHFNSPQEVVSRSPSPLTLSGWYQHRQYAQWPTKALCSTNKRCHENYIHPDRSDHSGIQWLAST